MGSLAVATVYSTNMTNLLVYNDKSSYNAAAAGHILLSIANILWLLYFGTTPEAPLHAWIDSFAINKSFPSSTNTGMGMGMGMGMSGMDNNYNNSMSRTNNNYDDNPFNTLDRHDQTYSEFHPQMYTAAQLEGLENTSEQQAKNSLDPNGMSDNDNSGISEYPYRAKALYSYEANPEDAHEISFDKGEILEISDIQGRWWQARRSNGEVGSCPSNYVELLNP